MQEARTNNRQHNWKIATQCTNAHGKAAEVSMERNAKLSFSSLVVLLQFDDSLSFLAIEIANYFVHYYRRHRERRACYGTLQ